MTARVWVPRRAAEDSAGRVRPVVAAAPRSRSSPAGGAHGHGPGRGVFQSEVVRPHGRRQGRGDGQGRAAGAGGQGQSGSGEGTGRRERGGGADAAGGQGAVRAFDGVHLAVRPVVEGHAGLVQAEGGADGEQSAGVGRRAGRGRAGECVAGHAEQGRETEEFGPGASPCGAVGASAGRSGRRRAADMPFVAGFTRTARASTTALAPPHRRSPIPLVRSSRPSSRPSPAPCRRPVPSPGPASRRLRAKPVSASYWSARPEGASPTGSLK
ncbi:hypothetical protein SVIOM74S_03147 [Streptomyces violarus]